MNDSWCRKTLAANGQPVSGGAARNVRIAARGGMDRIIERAVGTAVRQALVEADEAVEAANDHNVVLISNAPKRPRH